MQKINPRILPDRLMGFLCYFRTPFSKFGRVYLNNQSHSGITDKITNYKQMQQEKTRDKLTIFTDGSSYLTRAINLGILLVKVWE